MRAALAAFTACACLLQPPAHSQPQAPPFELDPALPALAEKESPAVLDTLRALTSVDSGSGQAAGLAAVADLVELTARALGADVERVKPANDVAGTNLVMTFRGKGKRSILLIAHMDTVYTAGTAAARPFRVEGNRAIAPGIADDKGGIAAFLHAMKLLKARGFDDYERVTMVFNTDEERGSSGSRDLIRAQAREHDYVLSGEPTGAEEGIVLATSGVGQLAVRVRAPADGHPVEELADLVLRSADTQREVPQTRMNWTVMRASNPADFHALPASDFEFATLTFGVKGRASHAGVSPGLGINAVIEAADIVRRVSDAAAALKGVRVHWRSAAGGLVSNIIPERAQLVLEVALPQGQDLRLVLVKLADAGARGLLSGVEIVAESAPGLPPKSEDAPQAFASADQRVPDAQAYAWLVRAARERIARQRFRDSSITVQDGLFFPAFNATVQGREMAQLALAIDAKLGGKLVLYDRTFGGTDAAWAGQSGKPVIESMGLVGGNYHSSEEEFILIDRIPRRLALVAEMIRALARQP